MTRVYSTSRAVRDFYANFCDKDVLLPKVITISEFESKAVIVKKRIFIDDDNRFLLLREAANFDEFKKLQFNSEFLTFLNHSKYIFKFLEELASEQIEINDLRKYDTYALYEEHLNILEVLKNRYISLMKSNNFVDKINIGTLYHINKDYLHNLEEIHIHIDGLLNKFEISLFEKCSKIVPLYIEFELNSYNKKLKSIFEELGFNLKIDSAYKLDVSNKKILTCKQIDQQKNINADVKVFNTRLSQIGYIFSSIERFVQYGIEPQNIAVVLPDESLVPYLKEFDSHKNLNFAMGFSLFDSNLYRKIEAIEQYINIKKDEQRIRIDRLEIPDSILKIIQKQWKRTTTPTLSIGLINELLSLNAKENESEIFKKEIFRFTRFLKKLDLLNLEQIFKLFLKRLKERSEDDIRGGKITVMGVLETRGSSFEGIIVPDFSDDFVPRRSGKDLFLNTQIRKDIGLPTKKDRENLQKYYYYQLFRNARQVVISSVANETTMPSRFLDELTLGYDTDKISENFNNVIFKKRENFAPTIKEINGFSYSLNKSELSATKLDTLLTCKRKFYFKYIKRVKEAQNILTSSNAKIGLKLHRALEKVFAKGEVLNDTDKIINLMKTSLMDENPGLMEEFELESWLVELEKFIANEKIRYEEGFRIFGNEVALKSKFEDFKIHGKLDRIDIKNNKFYVIDYKSGDISKIIKQKLEYMTNFQLEFYYLLAKEKGDVNGVFYYNLKDGKLVEEPMMEQKLEKLKSVLKSLKEPITSFEMCEKLSNCIYCPYKKLCLRDN